MRRMYLVAGVTALLAGSVGAAWIVRSSALPIRPLAARQVPGAAQAALPLSQVVLFSSGVGYFQREGEVEGNARVDLQFPIGDVNDLLKSLVLQDMGNGKIGAISYDGLDPVDRTLRSFAVDLTGNPSFGEVLNQARGEKVEVIMQQTAAGQPGTITGAILGMESQQTAGAAGMQEIHMLNLVCAEGMRSVNLKDIQRIRFLNPRMDSELHKALDVLSASHDSLKKQVSLSFKGEGKRPVRVGYVAENPIWKTSYRLSVNEDAKNKKLKGMLQGWAAVENTTDEDWNDVRVVLVSGRPISFQMDMYPPLYVPRPTVEPERFASLRPPSYSGALTRDKVDNLMGNQVGAAKLGQQGQVPGQAGIGGFGGIGGVGGIGGLGGIGGFGGGAFGQNGGQLGQMGGQLGNRYQRGQRVDPNMPRTMDEETGSPAGNRLTYEQLQAKRKARQDEIEQARNEGRKIAELDPHGKLAQEAAADEQSGLVRYVIEDKVSLPRQKSALLPLLDQPVQVSPVIIYNASVHQAHPLMGLRVKNMTGLPLTQGPITVYENSSYAGDARLPDLQPNEERLVSYALDGATEVKSDTTHGVGPRMYLTAAGKYIEVRHTARETHKYTIRNRSSHDRVLVVEHPVRSNWLLAKGQAAPRETASDVYRFDVPVPAGKTVEFQVAEEQDQVARIADAQVRQLSDLVRETRYATSNVGLSVTATVKKSMPELVNARIAKGMLTVTQRDQEEHVYTVWNTHTDQEVQVTIRHPVPVDWRVVMDGRPVEPRTYVEHEHAIPASKSASRAVVMERRSDSFSLLATTAPERITQLLDQQQVPAAVKAALVKVQKLRSTMAEQQAALAETQKNLREISEEQNRLRQNLEKVPANSALAKRYLDKLEKQEAEIEAMQQALKKAQGVEKQLQKELAEIQDQ